VKIYYENYAYEGMHLFTWEQEGFCLRQPFEFLCGVCFMIKPLHQLVLGVAYTVQTARYNTCVDCAETNTGRHK